MKTAGRYLPIVILAIAWEVVARLHEFFKHDLALHIARVATPDMRIPASPILLRALLPTAAKVMDETRRLLAVK